MMEAKYSADSGTQTGPHLRLNDGLFCITGDIYANDKIAPSSLCCPVRENCFTGLGRKEEEEKSRAAKSNLYLDIIFFDWAGDEK